MNIQRIPVANALFRQWIRARGQKRSQATRDFTRSWHHIEEDPFYADATESEIVRDLKDLAEDGWLKIVSERHYLHRIAKVRIPLETEARWKEAFEFADPDDSNARQIAGYDWSSTLSFLKTQRISVPFVDLQRLDQYLVSRRENAQQLAIKERSVGIFGDEKRLDELYRGSSLFEVGGLSLNDFDCHLVAEPLAWIRGNSPAGPVIVLENAATFETYLRWDQEQPRYGAVVYGGGNRFRDSARRMYEVYNELGGERETLYFGDLDAAGLNIPRIAADVFRTMGWSKLKPDLESYAKLIAISSSVSNLRKWDAPTKLSEKDLEWMESLGSKSRELILRYGRIAQEWVNLENLLIGDVSLET